MKTYSIDEYKLFNVSKKTDAIRDSLISHTDVEGVNDVLYWFEHFSVLERNVFPIDGKAETRSLIWMS